LPIKPKPRWTDSSNTAFWPSLSPSCTTTLWTEGSGRSETEALNKKIEERPSWRYITVYVADHSHPTWLFSPPGVLKKRILSKLSFHKCKLSSWHF
jgi:hypothetical protein